MSYIYTCISIIQVLRTPLHNKSIRDHPLKKNRFAPNGVSTEVLTTAASDHLGAKDSDSGLKIDLEERLDVRKMYMDWSDVFIHNFCVYWGIPQFTVVW